MSTGNYTCGPWYPVEYAGTFRLQLDPYYDLDDDLLDLDKNMFARTNSILAAASPELLESLEELLEAIPNQTNDKDWWPSELVRAVDKAKSLIDKVNR